MSLVLYAWIFFGLTPVCCASASQLRETTPTDEVRGYYRREHSLIKPYQGSGPHIPFWSFAGSTLVTEKYIRLTPDQRSVHGVLWNSIRVMSRDWEVILTLRVHGSTGVLFGDGMAFWYVKDPDLLGSFNQVFGCKSQFSGLGVFLDTYTNNKKLHNHAHPYISAMVNNGSLMYDHDTDGTHTQLGVDRGCSALLRNKDYDTSIMVRYVDDTVSVYLDIENTNFWRECFSVPGVQLPTGYYFGITAATGDLSDNHDIIAFKTYEIDLNRLSSDKDVVADRTKLVPDAKFVAAPRDHVEDIRPSHSLSWASIFVVFLTLIIVVVLVTFGVLLLQKHLESSRKRFY